MTQEMKDMLKALGVSDRGIAAIETDMVAAGAVDEAGLKKIINGLGSVDAIKRQYKISGDAAKALAAKFMDAPAKPAFSPAFASFFTPLTKTAGIDAGKVFTGLSGYGSENEIVELVTEGIIEDSEIFDAVKSGDEKADKKVTLGILKLRQAIEASKPVVNTAPPSPVSSPTSTPAPAAGFMGVAMPSMSFPEVPAGISLLSRLRVGGVLRVKSDTLVSALRVLFTERAGYFDIIETIRDAIEARAEKNGRSVPPVFLKLDSLSRSSEYADMLNLLKDEGIVDRRRYASKAAKDKLLSSLEGVFADLASVQKQLEGYVEQMTMGGGMTPQMMLTAFASIASGAPNPALMMAMQPPAPTSVVAAVTGMVDHINKMFSGTKALTAAALQPDVAAVDSILDNDEIYSALGAADREEALNELGLTASADLEQLEKNLLQYVLAVLDIPNKDSQSQPMYIGAVAMLGKSIVWDRLINLVRSPNYTPGRSNGSGRVSGIGDNNSGFSKVTRSNGSPVARGDFT